MAILSKIRERSLFLILVIGLALFAFVLDPSTLGDFFNSSKINEVGQVDGEVISRTEFATALENYRAQVGGNVSEMQAANAVWNNIVRKKVYAKQLAEAGITVGETDVWNQMLNIPYIQNNPQFQTSGIFDENKLKQFLATEKENDSQTWKSWQNMMAQLEQNSESTIYNNLVTAGLGASLKEGENTYLTENTKMDAQFVYVPYISVADSLVTVTEGDVQAYINAHADDFQVEESRDLAYVKFDIKPTEADELAIKEEVAKLVNDREEYSAVTKGNITVKGLKNAIDLATFFEENKSDLRLNETIQYKNQVPTEVSEAIFAGKVGDVFGPYKNAGHYNLSKITEVLRLPDSVSASHILIAHTGAQRARPEITKNKAQAKTTADSILAVVKRSPSKFASLAKQFSNDPGSADKGGKYEWFGYNMMTPNFRDFVFEGKKGDLDVVETPFGYHIIKIDNQKNFQNAVKLATFGKVLEASEATENDIFQKAESFAQDISKNSKEVYSIAKDKSYRVQPAVGIKVLDENVPGIGNQRSIVNWAFNKDTKVGSYKRFDVEGGYVVAVVTSQTPKGLMPAKKAMAQVRSIVANEKKAAIIEGKMNGNNLAEIAKANNTSVRAASAVNLKSPTISGVGNSPKVVGAMYAAEPNELYNKIAGDRGVFAFVVNKKELPTALPNYNSERNRITSSLKNKSFQIYEALKEASNVEDNRKMYYGIQ